MIGEVISPSDIRFAQLGLPTPDTLVWQQGLSRLSPGTLYGEAVVAHAQSRRAVDDDLARPVPGPHRARRCRSSQSILQAWPQIVSLIAGTILLYVIGYVAVPAARGAGVDARSSAVARALASCNSIRNGR